MSVKMLTPTFLASYCNIWEPREAPDGKMKYSCSMVFSKDADISGLRKAAETAAEQVFGKKWKTIKNFSMPFRDGDEERGDDAHYENAIFMNASAAANRQPGIVDQKRQPLFDQDDVYSGCICRAQVNFFGFGLDKKKTGGNQGVGVGLSNIQLIRKGERIDGRDSAEDAFDDIDDDIDTNNDPLS